MVKKKIERNAELKDNAVHDRESFLCKIKNGKDSFFQRLLGLTDVLEIPAMPKEAGEWEEGDELVITVKNTEVE